MDIDLKQEYKDIDRELKIGKVDPVYFKQLEGCVLKHNRFCTELCGKAMQNILGFLNEEETEKLSLIKTEKWNHLIVSKTIAQLIKVFDGKRSLISIFEAVKCQELNFFVLVLGMHHFLLSLENIEEDMVRKSITFSLDGDFGNFIRLVKLLYKSNLVELTGYSDITGGNAAIEVKDTGRINLENRKEEEVQELYAMEDDGGSKPRVLLLGDTVGTNSTGLLYLAAYLRRNGIEAYCQWNDPWKSSQSMKENVEALLDKLQPDIVGVSMKWFPHIARVLEICKIVKDFCPDIKVVVGGDTATYYSQDVIKYDCVDYVILGEGELPLLKICKNGRYLPNCVYKENGRIVSNPVTCVQTEESSSDVYLSHMDKIFADPSDPYYAYNFFILTSRGCDLNCFYCAGCSRIQKQNFGRQQSYYRNIEAVRRDILEAKDYTTTLMFEFEPPNINNSLDYYVKLWEGIDLSGHHCWLYFWSLPSSELLELIAQTFKYASISVDICSLSEPHRMKLTQLKLAKPQPKDSELYAFFDRANGFENIEIRICLIAGLPYFGYEDIEESNKTLDKILSQYKRFSSISWGRLHAQPGAALTYESEKYGMKSSAETFEDFLQYSRENLETRNYPDLQNINYPYIYYLGNDLNDSVTRFYEDTQKKLLEYHYSI